MTPPAAPSAKLERFAERWWVTLPGNLRRYSVLLAEAWSDGLYLTGWPFLIVLVPALALLLGLVEGTTHWSFLINDQISGGQTALTFTELLPFMTVTALLGAMSANLGLLVVLGYAVGDLLIFGSFFANNGGYFAPSDPIQAFIYLRVPQLVSYAILFSLAVMPTLSTRYMTPRLAPLLKLTEPTATILQTCVIVAVQGVLVYVWTLSAPLLIRVFWGWTSAPPPLAAAYYLQVSGGWVVTAAVLGAAVRGWLSYQTSKWPLVMQRTARLATALKEADTKLAFSRRLPSVVRSLLAALGLVLLVSGFVASLLEATILFVFVALILIARTDILPNLKMWVAWVAFIGRVPLLARLAGGALLGYILTLATLTWYAQVFSSSYGDTPSATLRPILVSMCLSLLVMTILLPRSSSTRSKAAAQPAVPQP